LKELCENVWLWDLFVDVFTGFTIFT
jgi:hypothetical protein